MERVAMNARALAWLALVPVLAGCRTGSSDGEREERAREEEEEAREGEASMPQARAKSGVGGFRPLAQPAGSGVAGLDIPISTSTERSLSENSIAVHPANPQVLLCANNSASLPANTLRDVHVGWSTDGGRTWTNLLQGPPGTRSFGDPAAAIDRAGRFYVGYKASNHGEAITVSEDGGASWREVQVARAPGSVDTDKGHIAVDVGPTSPFEGRVYFAWTQQTDVFEGGAVTIHCSFSSDHGSTWSPAALLSGTEGHQTGANVRTGPDGEVYCSWSLFNGVGGDEKAIAFNRSLDGGVTWEGPRRALANLRGIHRTGIPYAGLRVFSFPSMAVDLSDGPRRGWLYVFWVNVGHPGVNSGDADVFVWRSPDRGTTWDGPTRVNDDLTSNAQWQVWATCDDSSGDLYAVFYDRREDPSDREVRTYVARSSDGGETWRNFPVGDSSFVPEGIYGPYIGEYIGIAALDAHVYPVWGGWLASPTAYVSPFLVEADEIPPVLACPADLALECLPGGVPVTHPEVVAFLAQAAATDETDPEPELTHDAPAVFPLGATRVTFTAVDDAGNRSACTSIVSVQDGTPPAFELELTPLELWPPDHRLVAVTVTAAVADECDPEAGFVLAAIESSEPDEGTDGGDVPHDIQGAELGTPDPHFELRAERSGKGGDRTYTIRYTASDRSGNSVVRTVRVIVPHDRGR